MRPSRPVGPLQLPPCAAFRYVVADVFTDTPLTGNQLAVFTDARDLDPLTMQALAKEMNFSETVFVLPPQAADADVRIRIFTPASELPFAGHPIARVGLRARRPAAEDRAPARDRRGRRPGRARAGGAEIRFGWMEQPIPTWEPFARGGRAARRCSASSAPGCRSSSTTSARRHVYVELDSPRGGGGARARLRARSRV